MAPTVAEVNRNTNRRAHPSIPSHPHAAGGGEQAHKKKPRMLNGFDDIGLTLRHADKIRAYEAERIATKPWLNQRIG